MLIKKWQAKIVDIDNPFLNGELEHEIYMTIPEGYAECIEPFEEKEALKLEKAICLNAVSDVTHLAPKPSSLDLRSNGRMFWMHQTLHNSF